MSNNNDSGLNTFDTIALAAAGILGAVGIFAAATYEESEDQKAQRLANERRRREAREASVRAQRLQAEQYRKAEAERASEMSDISRLAMAMMGDSGSVLKMNAIKEIVACESDQDRLALLKAYKKDGVEFGAVDMERVRKSLNTPARAWEFKYL